jgi:hypothetical protein
MQTYDLEVVGGRVSSRQGRRGSSRSRQYFLEMVENTIAKRRGSWANAA